MQNTQSNLVETVTVNDQKIEIRRYQIGEKTEFRFPWRDPRGKRHFKCCRSHEDAKQAAQDFLTGSSDIEAPTGSIPAKEPILTPEQLAAAARVLGVQVRNGQSFDQTLSVVCEEFMTAKKASLDRGEIRRETYGELRSRTLDVQALLGEAKMDTLTVEVMDNAFSAYKRSARSLSNCRDALRAVLRWAVNRNKAPESVLKHFANMTVKGSREKDSGKIDPFTRREVVALLGEAMANKFDPTKTNYRLATVIALQAYGGMRAAEACKLPWEQIELENGVIRVPIRVAKTKQFRTFEILPCLRRWLECVPWQDRQGRVYNPFAYSKAQGRLARRLGRKMEGFHWRDNALRQAFIANYIAFSDSISRTAYLAGTSEAKIRAHYWRLVSKTDAIAYFDIMPSSTQLTNADPGNGHSEQAIKAG